MLVAVPIILMAATGGGPDTTSPWQTLPERIAAPEPDAPDSWMNPPSLEEETPQRGERRPTDSSPPMMLSWTAPPPDTLGEGPVAQQAPPPADRGLYVTVAGHVRFGFPFGAAERGDVVYGANLVIVSESLSWADLFDPGWGFDVELDLFFAGKPKPTSPRGFMGLNTGLALLLQMDEFHGQRATDSFGGGIDVGNLNMGSLLAGPVIYKGIGEGAYTKGHIALGVVHYSAVEATFFGPAIGQFRDELFKDTWTFASDFRGEIGYQAGPVGFSFGLGFRINAPPSEGSRVSLDSGAFWTFDISLGVELGF